MKYTRYTYGNKKTGNKGKVLLMGVIIIALAVIIGTVLSKFLIKDGLKKDEIETKVFDKIEQKDSKVNETAAQVKIYALQCGVFSKKENAEELLNKIKVKNNGFIAVDGEKFRVITGLYELEKVDEKIKELSSEGVTAMKSEINIKSTGETYSQVYEMMVATVKLLNKLDDKNIKSINTDEFKKWVNDIKVPSDKERGYKDFNDMKNICINIPKDLIKEKSNDIYKEVYGAIKSIK